MATEAVSNKPVPSDEAVSSIIKTGAEDMILSTGAGIVVGGLAAVVLARGGASGARKAIAGLGAGIGFGSAWQRCSITLEDTIQSKGGM